MGFLDYLGDAAKGAADAMLVDMERQAREKHDMAMANKAIEREGMQNMYANKQRKRQMEADAIQEDAKRKAAREERDADRAFRASEGRLNRESAMARAKISANRPRGETSAPKAAAPNITKTERGDTIAQDRATGAVLWARDSNGNPLDPKMFEGSGSPTEFTAADVRDGSTPRPGEVVDGYQYIGGDPSNQASWKKVR